MATTQNEGSGLFYFIQPDPVDTTDKAPQRILANQSQLYFAAVDKAIPHHDKYGKEAGLSYEDTKIAQNEFGIGNKTSQSNEFGKTTYLDFIRANGSAILNVNGDQVGNMDTAQLEDYKAYDEYYKHSRP